MKALNEKHVYDLTELTSEEKNELLMYLTKVNESWAGDIEKIQFFECDYLYFCFDWVEKGEWLVSRDLELIKSKQVTNAKELFYTLENVQIDCSELTEEQIKEMADVFKKYGYEIGTLDLFEKYCFIRKNSSKYCIVAKKDENKNTITYEKFMELFSKEENFKQLVEVLNEELTEEAYKETEYEVKYIAEKPKHYAKGIDTFARMEANCTTEECLAFAKGNIDKYNFRTKGQDLEDYKKIVSYANWAISLLNKA